MIERTQFIRDYLDRLKKVGLMEPSDIIDKIALNVIHGKISVEHSGLELEAEGQPGVRELVDLAIDEKISLRRVVQESLFKPMVRDDELNIFRADHPMVRSKEELYYFRIFTDHFGGGRAVDTVGQWISL